MSERNCSLILDSICLAHNFSFFLFLWYVYVTCKQNSTRNVKIFETNFLLINKLNSLKLFGLLNLILSISPYSCSPFTVHFLFHFSCLRLNNCCSFCFLFSMCLVVLYFYFQVVNGTVKISVYILIIKLINVLTPLYIKMSNLKGFNSNNPFPNHCTTWYFNMTFIILQIIYYLSIYLCWHIYLHVCNHILLVSVTFMVDLSFRTIFFLLLVRPLGFHLMKIY